MVSAGEIQPDSYGSDDFECESTICALSLRKQTSWDEFSKAVGQALMDHFQEISSDESWSLEDVPFNSTTDPGVGLGVSSVRSITLGISTFVLKTTLHFWVCLCPWAIHLNRLLDEACRVHSWQPAVLEILSIHKVVIT